MGIIGAEETSVVIIVVVVLMCIVGPSCFGLIRYVFVLRVTILLILLSVCVVSSHFFAYDLTFALTISFDMKVALLTVLYKISYINPVMRQPKYTRVDLSELGFPIAGGHSTPLHINVNLILTVGRVGLMARFIRTSFLVQVSSLVPILRFFHPGYYIQKLTSRCRDKQEEKRKNLASQRVLASSSRARNHVSRDSDPYSISQLGDSRRLSRSSSRRSIRFSKAEEDLEPHEEVDSEEESDPPEDSKPVSIREYLKGLTKRSSDKDSLDGEQAESLLLGNTDSKDSGSHVGECSQRCVGIL